jgi:hypothetical protein
MDVYVCTYLVAVNVPFPQLLSIVVQINIPLQLN